MDTQGGIWAGRDGMVEDVEAAVKHQTKRTVCIARLLKLGKEKDA